MNRNQMPKTTFKSSYLQLIKLCRSKEFLEVSLIGLGHHYYENCCITLCSSSQAWWLCCRGSKISLSLATYLQPVQTVTHASCATASLAAELMVVLKEELISLCRPEDLKLLPRALADPDLMDLCPKAQKNVLNKLCVLKWAHIPAGHFSV